MKQQIKNSIACCMMMMCVFFIMTSLVLHGSLGPKRVVTIKITPKFASAKKGYLQQELEAEAKRGYFFDFGSPSDRAQTFQIMAQTFKLPYGKNIDVYIQNLDEVAQHVAGGGLAEEAGSGGVSSGSGTGSGTGLSGDGTGTGGQGTGTGLGTGTGSGNGTGLSGDGTGAGGQGTGVGSGSGSGSGNSGQDTGDSSAQDTQKEVQEQPNQTQELPLEEHVQQPSLEEPKKEEKKVPEKPVLKPFEYTLEIVPLEKVTPEEKIASDELLLETLLKLMQTSYSAHQDKFENFWIDDQGVSAELPLLVNPQLAAKLKTEPMKVIKPTNGFELIWFVIKDRLIGAVGLVEQYKNRAALRTLLGSEDVEGTLKTFIDKELASTSFEILYEKLSDPQQKLLNAWIALFEPCFFDNNVVKSPKVRRMFETILINSIVARRVGLTGRSYEILSDGAIKKLLKTIIKPLLPLFKKELLEAPEDTTAPVKTGLMTDKQMLQEKQKKEEEQKKIKAITVDKDYVPEIYDRFNRLRIYPEFQKMFSIAGCEAIKKYKADQSPMKQFLYPLLLWLGSDTTLKQLAIFRKILNQALFKAEDPEITTIFDNTDLWKAIFDYHTQENKKNKKKVDIAAWLNNECMPLKDMNGFAKVIVRLKGLLNEKAIAQAVALENLLKGLKIKSDSVISLLGKIIEAENQSGKLEGTTEAHINKLIEAYNKLNEKKTEITEFLQSLKKEYESTKRPVTNMILKFTAKIKNISLDIPPKGYRAIKELADFKEPFYGLKRMPSTIMRALTLMLGITTLFTDIISADEFNNYVVPYGLLLDVIDESQAKFTELRSALNAMNSGIVKAQESYPESLKKIDNKSLVDKGFYKDKFKELINAINQKDIPKIRSEIEAYVKIDPINPTEDPAAKTAFNQLLSSLTTNLAQQFMSSYSITVKVLNDGSAQCPEEFKDCLIAELPLSNVTSKVQARNARIYKSFTGLLGEIVILLNPNDKPLTSGGLQNLNSETLKNLFAQFLEKTKTALEDKNFDKVWITNDKQNECNTVLEALKNYCDALINNITMLKSQAGSSGSSTSSAQPSNQPGFMPPPPAPGQEGGFAPPPPPPPMPGGDSGVIPPPPPPPPM